MGFGSWFTKALDVVTPWDRGGERKRREEEEERNRQQWQPRQTTPTQQSSNRLRVDNSQSSARVSVDGNEPEPEPEAKRPENLFKDINKAIRFNKPNNTRNPVLDIGKAQTTDRPQPGTVVQPRLRVENRPNNTKIKLPDFKALSPEEQARRILERDLNAGKSWEQIARENRFDIDAVKAYSEKTRPNYGIKIERPNQSLGNRFRDIFDANTEADKFRRQEGNALPGADQKNVELVNPGNIVSRTPIVGHAVKTINTLAAQVPEVFYTVQGQFATNELSTAAKALEEARASGDPLAIRRAERRWNDAQGRVDDIFGMQDATEQNFKKNSGGFMNAGTLYDAEGAREGDAETAVKDIALPTATAMLDVYTLGKGNLISEALKQQGYKNVLSKGGADVVRRVGGRQVVQNAGPKTVAQLVAGNYLSGQTDALANDASFNDSVKAGLITAPLGTLPDLALPGIGRMIKSRFFPRRFSAGRTALGEVDNAAIRDSVDELIDVTTPKKIPVAKDIPITGGDALPQPVNVRNLNEPGQLIRETSEDAATATPNPLIRQTADDIREQAARDAFFDQQKTAPTPNRAIEGITPRKPDAPYKLEPEVVGGNQKSIVEQYAEQLRELGEGNGVEMIRNTDGSYRRVSNNVRPKSFGSKKATKAQWLEEAQRQLDNGEADPGFQKAFNDAADPEVQSLLAKGEQPEASPGRPIDVKEVKSIDVTDQTKVPTDTPETPGRVRVTTSTEPAKVKAEIAARTVPALPKEVQEVLDNPKKFTKRQVASARNQRKLARQMAKTQEETAEAMDRINTASPAKQSDEGFVSTGRFAKGENGPYEKVSRQAEMAQAVNETANMSPEDVIQSARKNQGGTGGFTRRDIRNVAALFETKRIKRGTPLWNEARQILKEDGTIWGQTGALRNYTMRRTASADELISRYESKIYRMVEDPSKIDSKLFDDVEAAQTKYVVARDNATKAYNDFTKNPTPENAKAYHRAMDAAEQADAAAKQVEYTAAEKMLKKNKDVGVQREIQKMAQEADMYQMDAVDASMLSGTGTFTRNFVNASVGGIEEGIFGKPAAWISRKLTKQSVGGGAGRGVINSFGKGTKNLVDVAGARAKAAGKNPLEHLKNWSTTGNQLGDTIMDTQAYKNVADHYYNQLKKAGYSGRELTDRASVMARQDPDGVLRQYQGAARIAAGLGRGITRNNKIETAVKNIVADSIPGADAMWKENVGKLVARMTVGFPTAIGRSAAEGAKRFTLGAPSFIKAALEKDPLQRAILIKEGIKQAGTGSAVIPPMFYAMGANDMITGSYPDSEEERARWEREGISENSVKIGGAYYQLPAYLGSWAVPGLFWASMGRNDGDVRKAASETAKIIPDLLPLENRFSDISDALEGRGDLSKIMTQMSAGTVRAATPAGALLNQLAKTFDSTKNETNDGTAIENFWNKVQTGIPGLSNRVPNKLDDAGNTIQNPNGLELALGATSAVQSDGEAESARIQGEVDSALETIAGTGALQDENLREILDDDTAKLYDKANSGEKLTEDEVSKLHKELTEGVSQEGSDTAYLERGQYDTHLAVLNLKKQLMEADKTVAPSKLEKINTAIKRGEVYRDNKIPYETIDNYQSTGVEAWRRMGDPESEDYDPDMYQALWAMDELMTNNGVSDGKELDEMKYYLKKSGSGSGSGSSKKATIKSFGTDFGKIKRGSYAPQLKEYETIKAQSGGIPRISVQRPNTVRKISVRG